MDLVCRPRLTVAHQHPHATRWLPNPPSTLPLRPLQPRRSKRRRFDAYPRQLALLQRPLSLSSRCVKPFLLNHHAFILYFFCVPSRDGIELYQTLEYLRWYAHLVKKAATNLWRGRDRILRIVPAGISLTIEIRKGDILLDTADTISVLSFRRWWFSSEGGFWVLFLFRPFGG